MELVTGFKGEAHISAENWADLNRGLAGDGSYVLPVGEKFRAELVTNNLLKIYDGCGIFQGRQVVIPAGQSDEITIENGSQGEKRIDIVGVRYVKDESSKIETTESVYVKGTPAESDPVAPTLEEGNIRAGDLAATWALYQLELDGLNVVSVTPLFETLRSGAEVAEELEALNSNSYKLYTGILGGIQSRSYTLKKYNDGTFELSARADTSQVRFAHSTSANRYYFMLTVTLPDELTLADDRWVFSGSIVSSGIYDLTPNNIQGKTLSMYISANADPGQVDYINAGFILKGRWA